MTCCAIFDLDGTLIDSMHVWEKIDIDFLKSRGISIPSGYSSVIRDMSFKESALYTIRRFCLTETEDELMDTWNLMAASEYGENIFLKPHAMEYLKTLMERGVSLGIATSLPPVLYEAALTNNGIYDLFDVICSASDVTRGKEHPDIFLHAARKLNAAPENCVVFEDILPAVRSAKLAGMKVCGVYDNSSKEQWDDICRAADWAIYDFADAPLLG